MRVAIVGAGAIGCLFGIKLHGSGQSVTLVHHNRRTVASMRRTGVILREISGRTIKAHLEVTQSLPSDDPPELILVTVKAYDTETVARQLRAWVSPKTLVLSLQNGLGNVETLSRHVPGSSILAASTTEAVLQLQPGVIAHKGRGITWIGELKGKTSKRCDAIKRLFLDAGFRAVTSGNIIGVIWSKAIVNSAINPISALTRVSNRDILKVANLRRSAFRILGEGAAVAKACGVSPSPPPESLLRSVLASSGKNRSSMLQDIEAGKRTEIRQINGKISSIGNKLRIDAPCTGMLTQLILGIEELQ